MKLRVTFKDPDGPADCIDEAIREEVGKLKLDGDEEEAVFEVRREKLKKKLAKWLPYMEYVTIEFDTDAGTATVVPKGE